MDCVPRYKAKHIIKKRPSALAICLDDQTLSRMLKESTPPVRLLAGCRSAEAHRKPDESLNVEHGGAAVEFEGLADDPSVVLCPV
jgi:hypothetical protein